MKVYGSKICLVRTCTCCSPRSKDAKLKANRARARREGKKEINDGLQSTNARKEKRIR